MRRIVLICFIQGIFLSISIAQTKRGNVAIFGGTPASLDFNFEPPLATRPPGFFSSDEGSSSICDLDGNLLFYTNGNNVWNKNHQPMPNSGNVSGYTSSSTSTQSAIVSWPKDPFKYFLFTPQYQGRNFVYSLIDMRLGRG